MKSKRKLGDVIKIRETFFQTKKRTGRKEVKSAASHAKLQLSNRIGIR